MSILTPVLAEITTVVVFAQTSFDRPDEATRTFFDTPLGGLLKGVLGLAALLLFLWRTLDSARTNLLGAGRSGSPAAAGGIGGGGGVVAFIKDVLLAGVGAILLFNLDQLPRIMSALGGLVGPVLDSITQLIGGLTG